MTTVGETSTVSADSVIIATDSEFWVTTFAETRYDSITSDTVAIEKELTVTSAVDSSVDVKLLVIVEAEGDDVKVVSKVKVMVDKELTVEVDAIGGMYVDVEVSVVVVSTVVGSICSPVSVIVMMEYTIVVGIVSVATVERITVVVVWSAEGLAAMTVVETCWILEAEARD